MIEVLGSSGIYAAVFLIVIAVASLFGLVVFASKEEKFEDVIAAQKKEQEVLFQTRNSSASKSSKSKKKWAKVKKEKYAKLQDKKDGPEHEENSVDGNIEQDIKELAIDEVEIIEAPRVEHKEAKVKPEKKRGGKEKKKASVALSAEEQALKEEPSKKKESSKKKAKAKVEEKIVEVVEEVVEAAPEMVSLEALPDSRMIEELFEASMDDVKEPPKGKVDAKVEEKKQMESALPQKKSKSKKAKPTGNSKVTVDKITNDVASAQLNNVEVQQLIDVLLHKQNEAQLWQKPNQRADPIEELKKRVQGLESQLSEEKNTSIAAAKKSKELRQEMQQEKSQFQKFQSQANQKISQQAGEIQAFQKRMEATQESHLREMQNSQAQLNKMKDMLDQSSSPELQRLKDENTMFKNASMRVQQITEENGQLKQASTKLRSELDSALMQLKQHQQQNVHYEEKLASLEKDFHSLNASKGDSEAVLSKQLSGVTEQLRRLEVENHTIASKLQQTEEELKRHENVKRELLTKTVESESSTAQNAEVESLKSSLKAAEERVKHYEELESQNSDILKKLAEEKSALEEKLKKEEIVIVEKEDANGDAADSLVSQEKHMQLINEKDKVISELKEDMKSTKEELEKLANVLKQEKEEKDQSVKGLEESLKELEEKMKKQDESMEEKSRENKKMEEIVEASKTKNNDLREKNWKAMDAVATAEANGKKKIKETEEAILSMFKTIRPAIKLEKSKPFDEVLKGFEEQFLKSDKKKRSRDSCSGSESSSDSDSDDESKGLKKLKNEKAKLETSNKELEEKLADLAKEKSDLEDNLKEASVASKKLEQLTEEYKNANSQVKHYKGILEETETMLKKLENCVESQVSSYEKKLQGKELELKEMREKVSRIEEEIKNNDDKSQLEIDLKKVQVELDDEKKLKSELASELEEAKAKLIALEEAHESSIGDDSMNVSQESLDTSGSSSPKKKKSLRHALGKAFRKKSENTDEMKTKLSVADDHLAKLEADKKELSERLGQVSDSAKAKDKEIETLTQGKDSVDKENTKLKEKLKVFESAGSASGKSDKENDVIIAKLRLENAELLEDLREERDRVVVDVESVDSEKLKSELQSLKGEFEKEKDSSTKLNTSVNELEEELQKTKSDLGEMQKKYKEAADKLIVSEQRSKELELAGLTKSERIEKEIDEAIQSDNSPTSPQRTIGTPLVTQLDEIKTQLAEKEKQLENERQVNKQLRVQVAALASDASHGTSV